MKKENTFLILACLAIGSSVAALVIDDHFSVAFGCIAVFIGYCMSLCGRGRMITLPTQCLDDAGRMMSGQSGRWHLVAVPGRCVVAYQSSAQALDALSSDAVGYAVYDGDAA
jgi:hypothetical protein